MEDKDAAVALGKRLASALFKVYHSRLYLEQRSEFTSVLTEAENAGWVEEVNQARQKVVEQRTPAPVVEKAVEVEPVKVVKPVKHLIKKIIHKGKKK